MDKISSTDRLVVSRCIKNTHTNTYIYIYIYMYIYINSKVYNVPPLNRTRSEVERFSEKIWMFFGEIYPYLLKSWQFVKSSKEYGQKSWGITLVCRFLQIIWFHTQRKDGKILLTYFLLHETIIPIMLFYKARKKWFANSMVSLTWSLESCKEIPKQHNYLKYVVNSISFQTIIYRHLELSKTLENSVCYCYTSYEMTDQFLWFLIQMNNYSSNWNTPY